LIDPTGRRRHSRQPWSPCRPARAVIVERGARNNGDIGERAVVIVVIEDAGGAVARDVDVRPAVVVIIENGNAEAVMPVGLIDVRFRRDVFKTFRCLDCDRGYFSPTANRAGRT